MTKLLTHLILTSLLTTCFANETDDSIAWFGKSGKPCNPVTPALTPTIPDFYIGPRVGAFYAVNKRLQEVYGRWHASYQIEAAGKIGNSYQIWGNAEWIPLHGTSTLLHNSTRCDLINLSAGFSYTWPLINHLDISLGLGPTLGIAAIRNHASHIDHHSTRLGPGLIFKSNLNWSLKKNISLILFTDYRYQPIHFDQWRDVGGLSFGLGIRFN